MFGSLGPMEIMIIFAIVLIVFGADRLPELARGLGKGIREFKRAADDVKREIMIDPDLNINLDLNEPLPEHSGHSDDLNNEDDWESREAEAVSAADQTTRDDSSDGDDQKESNAATDEVEPSKSEDDVSENQNTTKKSEHNSDIENLTG